jgi:hypothetical protein
VLASTPRSLSWSLGAYLIGFAALAVALAFFKGLQDPDYFWHVRTGELVASSGIPSTDPYSFTYRGPWTLHEWLGQLAIYHVVRLLGPTGALAVFALLPPLAVGLLAIVLARRGVPTRAIVAATLLCGAVLIPYVTVRPQVISWVFLAALVALLVGLRPARVWLLAALPPFFAVWANVHGLYVVGLGVLAVFIVFTLAGRTSLAGSRVAVVAAGVVSGLASAITPAGIPGLLYPLRYVDSGDWGLANIPEWQSPNFHDAVQLPLLALIILLMVVDKKGAPGWLRAVAYLSVAGALLANRNAPVAAVACLPVVAMALGRVEFFRRGSAADWRRRGIETAAAALVVVSVLMVLPTSAGAQGVVLRRYPAAAVDELAEIRDVRVVAEYGWAGYVIHELASSGGLVFVDGRNDMYPEEILDQYSQVRAGEPGWNSVVDAANANALLFPPDAPIVRGVAQADGWCEAYADAKQVLLLRSCS